MVIIDSSGAKAETASHGKQPRFPVKGTGAVFASLHGACQERGDLRSCAGAGGIELAVADAIGDAVFHGPGHRVCVVSVTGAVHKADSARRRGLAHGPPQHRHHLGAVDGAVGVRAVGNALVLGPILRLFVPGSAAVQICVILSRQNRPQLRPGGGGVGGVDRVAHAVHQSTGADEIDGVLGPVVPGVDEALGVVNDLHRGSAVHGEPDAVLRGNGVFDDLLRAVRMDKNGHRTELHVGNGDLHLGLTCPLGQFHLDGGRGVAVAGSLYLHGGLDRLAVLLRVLDGLAADLRLRRCLAFTVLDGGDGHSGGAVGRGGFGGLRAGGHAVFVGFGFLLRFRLRPVLGGDGLGLAFRHRAVLLGLGPGLAFGLRAVLIGHGLRLCFGFHSVRFRLRFRLGLGHRAVLASGGLDHGILGALCAFSKRPVLALLNRLQRIWTI